MFYTIHNKTNKIDRYKIFIMSTFFTQNSFLNKFTASHLLIPKLVQRDYLK